MINVLVLSDLVHPLLNDKVGNRPPYLDFTTLCCPSIVFNALVTCGLFFTALSIAFLNVKSTTCCENNLLEKNKKIRNEIFRNCIKNLLIFLSL
jgi:hypothetical protein